MCSRACKLTPRAERFFCEAQEDFHGRGLSDEVAQVTIDFQWWLIISGRHRGAAQQSEWLLQHLDRTTFDSELIKRWIQQMHDRRLSHELVIAVFRDVRGLPRISPTLASFH